MVAKKRFGVKYTRQSGPEHFSSDEGINPYLPPQTEKKTMEKSRGDAPSTSHSSSAIKGSNDKSKHGIHLSLDLTLKFKLKVSNIHCVSDQQLITKQQFGIVYIPRLSTPPHFSILSPTIRQPFSMFCNVTATFPHDRETFGSQFRNCLHSSASHSATSDRCRRLYRLCHSANACEYMSNGRIYC